MTTDSNHRACQQKDRLNLSDERHRMRRRYFHSAAEAHFHWSACHRRRQWPLMFYHITRVLLLVLASCFYQRTLFR